MAEARRAALDALYRATTYRVVGPDGLIDVRVGQPCVSLDALLSRHRAGEWAFITACNPGSQPRPPEENTAAHERLLEVLQSKGFACYCAAGIPDHPGWAPERSLWVPGIGRWQAAELGRQFGQSAIVVGTAGGPAELLDCG